MKKVFSTYRHALFNACLKGYAHLSIAQKIKWDYTQGHLEFKQSPTFWFFTYSAHSECAFSHLIKIIETRKSPNPNNMTIHKFLNVIEQNACRLFEPKDKDIVMCEILKDRVSLKDKNEVITKLMCFRDRFLSHYDRSTFMNGTFFKDNRVDDDSLDELYKHLEGILNKYSLLYDGTEMPNALSSWKITFDLDFKAFED